MLTAERLQEFQERGVTRVPAAMTRERVDALRERIWEFVGTQHGIRRDDPKTWKRVLPSMVRRLVDEGVFDAMADDGTRSILDQLLGADAWHDPRHWGQLLMDFPESSEWALPTQGWHLDYPAPAGQKGLPGVQLFLLLDQHEPRAGATLAIAGSHRCVERLQQAASKGDPGRSGEVRKALRREVPWLKQLWSERPDEDRIARFMAAPETVDGIPLQVVEMCGEPGDLIVTHGWTLHAASPRCGSRPRMMLTERLRPRSLDYRVMIDQRRAEKQPEDESG